MKETLNQYDKQASDFLAKFGIEFRATLSDSKSSPWHEGVQAEGHHYRVTLSKGKRGQGVKFGQRVTFDFWGSIADAEKGIKTVTEYDVLACISGDANRPDTFADFCSEYGYETDSIKSLQTFRRCSRFAKRLQAFFTSAEIEALQEIQ